MTKRELSHLLELSPYKMGKIEDGKNEPEQKTVRAVSNALKFPVGFFFREDPYLLEAETVSFRSLSRRCKKDQDGAEADIGLAGELLRWTELRFHLPEPDLPDLSDEPDPEIAARTLRQNWSIGFRPIGHIISFLETHGVRFFSAGGGQSPCVDAFSHWIERTPLIFLNRTKTAERSIFDAAHELGHLVFHKHRGRYSSQPVKQKDKECEANEECEANKFASAFLMPSEAVRAYTLGRVTPEAVLREKTRWRVSAMAMLRRLYSLKVITDWQYRDMCIAFARRGFRSDEPGGIEWERSDFWQRIFSRLWRKRITMNKIADSLDIPLYDLESLMHDLVGSSARPVQDHTNHKLHVAK